MQPFNEFTVPRNQIKPYFESFEARHDGLESPANLILNHLNLSINQYSHSLDMIEQENIIEKFLENNNMKFLELPQKVDASPASSPNPSQLTLECIIDHYPIDSSGRLFTKFIINSPSHYNMDDNDHDQSHYNLDDNQMSVIHQDFTKISRNYQQLLTMKSIQQNMVQDFQPNRRRRRHPSNN